jgi:hypothetical protein
VTMNGVASVPAQCWARSGEWIVISSAASFGGQGPRAMQRDCHRTGPNGLGRLEGVEGAGPVPIVYAGRWAPRRELAWLGVGGEFDR